MAPLPAALAGAGPQPWWVWRIDAEAYAASWDSGLGAELFGGRWNPKGLRAVYCRLDPATCLVEAAVHHGARLARARGKGWRCGGRRCRGTACSANATCKPLALRRRSVIDGLVGYSLATSQQLERGRWHNRENAGRLDRAAARAPTAFDRRRTSQNPAPNPN